jgi:hypothetical protein
LQGKKKGLYLPALWKIGVKCGGMYIAAHRYSDDIIFYFDAAGNKHVAKGGNLAWRTNNPGLVHSHNHYTGAAIGHFQQYAIFATPEAGRKALAEWVLSKKFLKRPWETLAMHYWPDRPDAFIGKLSEVTGIVPGVDIRSLSSPDLSCLLMGIEKICKYGPTGQEQFFLLPKIEAKLANSDGSEVYLLEGGTVLSKQEAMQRVLLHQLDAVIVHLSNGTVYLRSRPNYCMKHISIHAPDASVLPDDIALLVRTVGAYRKGQCIWGFFGGISNARDETLASAKLISEASNGELVFTLPNDRRMYGVQDLLLCFSMKMSHDPVIVQTAVKFLQYLLETAEKEAATPPVVVFAHSQGAIIAEHALQLLSEEERQRIRLFTLGGGSFIAPGQAHPDSHNYVSATDYVCHFGSPNLQHLALQLYFGRKQGKEARNVISQLAADDALFDLDSANPTTIALYAKQRAQYYERQLLQISNVTVLDPDPKERHVFVSSCYQKALKEIVQKYL